MKDETKKFNIIVLGDSAVGKTSLINRCHRNSFAEQSLPSRLDNPVVSMNYGEEVYEATLVDTYGGEDYIHYRRIAYLCPKKFQPDMVLLCIPLNNRLSYAKITTEWLPELRHYVPKKPIILVGTRCDLEATITQQECHELKDTIKACYYVECSAIDGTGVKTVFDYAVIAYTNSKSKRRCTVL